MQVLFVCDNDLVRGPMARALAERFAQEQRLAGTTFESAGLHVREGHLPPVQFVWFMADQRFDMSRHRPAALSPRACREADLILCMTHELAHHVRARLTEVHAGRVVVLNSAVGFTGPNSRLDVNGPPSLHPRALLAVYSQLKASVGRLVRMLGEGHPRPEDFGAKGRSDATDPFDDPAVRRFIAQGIVDFLERSYEPPTTDHLLDMLAMVGRRLSEDQFLRLLDEDLSGIVRATADGHGWELGSARAKRDAPPPRSTNGTMSNADALTLLGLTASSTRAHGQRAWKKMLVRYHPDKFHDDEEFRRLAEAKTRRLNQAWDIVRDLLDEG